MTTLNVDVTGATRDALARGYWAALGRMGTGGAGTPRDTALNAVGTALAGVQTSVSIDTSALNRRDLSSVMRLIDSCAVVLPNSAALTTFARSIEAADAAANPTANLLRFM